MKLLKIGSILACVGCGAFEDRYIDYTASSGTTSGTQAGSDYFSASLISDINSCITSGCHASVKIGGQTVVKDDAATTRDAFIAYHTSSSATSNGGIDEYPFESSHNGSSVANGIDGLKDKLTEWVELEEITKGQASTTEDSSDVDPTFANIISTKIDSCIVSGCHATTQVAGQTLVAGDDTANAAAIRNYQSTKASDKGDVWTYIASDSHSGKSVASSTELDTKLKTWLEKYPDSDE